MSLGTQVVGQCFLTSTIAKRYGISIDVRLFDDMENELTSLINLALTIELLISKALVQ